MPKKTPILSILGPTGVGKTKVALALAEQLLAQKKVAGVDILSADSRQVYRDIPILSGADVPAEFKNFTFGQISLHGIGMLAATESWSLGQFQSLFFSVHSEAEKNNRALVVVGGTALYHKQVLQNDPRLRVQPDDALRTELYALSVGELQAKLGTVNQARLDAMNASDRANPRRLVRAIEQESAQNVATTTKDFPIQKFLLVTAAQETLANKITLRVQERFRAGAVTEVKNLLQIENISEQLTTACGFAEIAEFIAGKISEADCIAAWTQKEIQYAKSQQKWRSQFPNAVELCTDLSTWHDDLLMLSKSVY